MSGGFEIALWALLLIATITDLRWGKIPNALVFPFLVLGLIAKFVVSTRVGLMQEFNLALAAVAFAFFLFFPLWVVKAFAAGDVKLLMAVGALSSPRTVVVLGASSIVLGSIVGLFLLLKNRGVRAAATSLKEHATSIAPSKGMRMPFAPAFLCAFCVLQIAEVRQWHLW